MARDYQTLKRAIQDGHTVRLRDGRMISRVEDLPAPETGDLRSRPLSEDEGRRVLDENDALKRENERLKNQQSGATSGPLREGGPGISIPPIEVIPEPESVELPPAQPRTGGTVEAIQPPATKTSDHPQAVGTPKRK